MRHIFFVFIVLMSLSETGRAGEQEIKLTYKAYFGGFVISKIHSTGRLSSTDYQVDISYQVTGFATIFSNMKNQVSARGKIDPDGRVKPLAFENKGSWSRYHFSNRTEFSPEDSRITAHEFDFKFKEAAEYIPLKAENGYGPDMASFYLGLTLDENAMQISEEEKHQNIFGGFFLLDIAYRCTEKKAFKHRRTIYEGEVLICEFSDKIIDGGFKALKKKRKKKRKKKKKNTDVMEPTPLHIWYGKLDELDMRIPVYSEFSFGWGKVRVYLSEIEVIDK